MEEEPNNDVTATELAVGLTLIVAVVLFLAAWLGSAVECDQRSCPPGQEPELVRSHSTIMGASCACVLRGGE